MNFKARVTGFDNTAKEAAAYSFEGCIKQGDNDASTAFVGTPIKTILGEDDATWDAEISADTTNGALVVTVTGDASNSVKWIATIEYAEVRI